MKWVLSCLALLLALSTTPAFAEDEVAPGNRYTDAEKQKEMMDRIEQASAIEHASSKEREPTVVHDAKRDQADKAEKARLKEHIEATDRHKAELDARDRSKESND